MGGNNLKLLHAVRGSQHIISVEKQDHGVVVHPFMNLPNQCSATVKKANDKSALPHDRKECNIK